MSSAAQKMIFLKSSDGEILEVEEAVAFESQTIKRRIENKCMIEDKCIPLRYVTSKILAKVIEYCKRHADAAAKANADGTPTLADNVVDEDLKAFDAEFVNVDRSTLFGLVEAACYLKIKSLVDLTCQTLADMIEGKTPEELRRGFSILKNYLILAEEEEVRRENELEEMRRENAVMPS